MPDATAKNILDFFKNGARGNTVLIFVPSHDKKKKELNDQAQWASQAMDLFAENFGGATGFQNLLGTWFDPDSGEILADVPIMVQSLADPDRVTEKTVKKVLEFGRRMGKATNQACVGIVVNDVFYELMEFEEK